MKPPGNRGLLLRCRRAAASSRTRVLDRALALAAQWVAAKVALGAAPPLELATVRFTIASVVLVALSLATRTAPPIRRWRSVTAAAALGFFGSTTSHSSVCG